MVAFGFASTSTFKFLLLNLGPKLSINKKNIATPWPWANFEAQYSVINFNTFLIPTQFWVQDSVWYLMLTSGHSVFLIPRCSIRGQGFNLVLGAHFRAKYFLIAKMFSLGPRAQFGTWCSVRGPGLSLVLGAHFGAQFFLNSKMLSRFGAQYFL